MRDRNQIRIYFKAPNLPIITKLTGHVGSKYGFVAARTESGAMRVGCRGPLQGSSIYVGTAPLVYAL